MIRRARRTSEEGSATLQAAFVMGTVLFIFLGIIQYVYWQRGTHIAIAAANEGNRYGRFADGSAHDAQVVTDAFLDQAPGSVWDRQVNATRDMAGPLATSTVEVRGTAFPVLRWLQLPIHARSSGPAEQARPTPPGP